MQIDVEIKKLFQMRDEAVARQDRQLFLSTQVTEIEHGASQGYLGVKHLETEVLSVYQENELEKVVFVKETYAKDPDKYSAFLAYHLVQTVKGWKIYRVK